MIISIYFILLVFIVGCCIGSFLNVVIIRAFNNESIIFPPSKCPNCNHKLKFYHNIPIVSYVFLKGKCAYCGKKISIQYPLVEILTGFLFLLCSFKFKYNILPLVFSWYFISIFIVLAVCDIREKVIFDYHSYFLILGGLVLNYFNIWNLCIGTKTFYIHSHLLTINNSFINALIGIFVGILIMEVLAGIGYLFAGTRAFGEGDSYIAAGLGAVFGWKLLIMALFYAFFIQIVFTLPLYLKKLSDKKDIRTIIGFLIFFILIIIIKLIEFYTYNPYLYLSALFGLLISALYICKRIILSLKKSINDDFTFLPFGPAMVIGATYLIMCL